MTMQNSLDQAIRNFEKQDGGYELKGNTYLSYMKNSTWNHFLEEMQSKYPHIYDSYGKGMGKELKEKRYPPKMASYGSSSRFIYLLARDIKGFDFEKQFDTIVGGISNLDGFYSQKDVTYCVEAKCREIYGSSHKGEKRSESYKNLLEFISTKCKSLSFICTPIENNKISIVSKCQGSIIKHFDIIQLICHFCGIANQLLSGKLGTRVKFIYLIYNPNILSDECFAPQYRKKLLSRYDQTLKEISNIDFNEVFDAIVVFLAKKEHPDFSIDFVRADQNSFMSELNV